MSPRASAPSCSPPASSSTRTTSTTTTEKNEPPRRPVRRVRQGIQSSDPDPDLGILGALGVLAFHLSVVLAGCTGVNVQVQVGPRPYYLVNDMDEGALKDELLSCREQPMKPTQFSIGHRGATMQFPEETAESIQAGARMGAGILECDVTFTRDRQLVCRHSQCDLHSTTNILTIPELAAKCTQPFRPADPASARPASAKCCSSDLSLAEFRRLRGKMDGANPNARTIEDY